MLVIIIIIIRDNNNDNNNNNNTKQKKINNDNNDNDYNNNNYDNSFTQGSPVSASMLFFLRDLQLLPPQHLPGTHLYLGGEWQISINVLPNDTGLRLEPSIYSCIESQFNEPPYHDTFTSFRINRIPGVARPF